MSTTALQMLEMASNHSAKIYEQMDRQMTQSLEIRQQASNAEVNLAMKGVQFAEEQRMNDAQITNMNFGNAIRAKQHELDVALAPLKFQSAQLQLESQKIQFHNQKKAQDTQAFNSITQAYNDMMGLHLLETQNPDHAKSYLGYQARWMDRVANGGEFNANEYEKGLRKINEAFKDAKVESKGYSPSLSHMLGQISPVIQQRYERENKATNKFKNEIMMSLVSSTDSQFADRVEGLQGALAPDEIGFARISKDTLSRNKNIIDEAMSNISKSHAALKLIPESDKTTATRIQSTIDFYNEQLDKANASNLDIMNRISQGKYNFDEAAQIVEDSKPPRGGPNPGDFETPNTAPIFGVSAVDDPTMHQNFSDVRDALVGEGGNFLESEAADVDLNWFANRVNKDGPDFPTLTKVSTKVKERLKARDNIAVVFNKPKVDKLLATINRDTEVPLDEGISNLIRLAGVPRGDLENLGFIKKWDSPIAAHRFLPSKSVVFSGASTNFLDDLSGRGGIRSYEDMVKIINQLPTKEERKQVTEELYSLLVTAALSNAVKEK